MKKNIIVKVMTPEGERHVVFRPVVKKEETEIFCDTECPYGKNHLCDKLRDPRDPSRADYCFMSFCQEIDPQTDLVTPDKSINMNDYVPIENTIEDNLADIIDVNNDILKTNPCVRIDKVVDTICPDWCPDYMKDHSKCSSKNMSCIIRSLFQELDRVDESESGTESRSESGSGE